MKIINVGYNYKHPEDFCINRPQGSGDYLLLVLKSNAFFVFNNKTLIAPPCSVVFFNKETPQLYGASDGEFINDWVHFEIDDNDASMFKELEIPFDSILTLGDVTMLSGFIKSMFSERYSQNIHKDEALNLYFRLILYKLSEVIKSPELKKENRFYGELSGLRSEIYLKPDKAWTLDEISKKINLSRSYIQHLYKSLFGVSITTDITNSRIEYAKYLLSSTDMTISCIAQLCGYSNDVHFMRIFKKTAGVTPSQFRKQTHICKDEVENAKNQTPFRLQTK